MNPKISKNKRKEMLKSLKNQQRLQEIEKIPISKSDLKELFDWLDRKLATCDHTLKYTIQFITEKDLPKSELISWLNEQGGYCDCEVLANVESKWSYINSRA